MHMNHDPRTVSYVYRHNNPAGYKGRTCHMLTLGQLLKDALGRNVVNTGGELVTIQFDDTGEKLTAEKQAIIPAASRLGRVFIRNARRTA